MSYPTHLIKISNRFYYKIKVPVDLLQYFSCTFIKKSLRTSDLHEAKTILAAMEFHTHRGLTLLRTGMLPVDIALQVVKDIMPSKGRVTDTNDIENQNSGSKNDLVLSEVIKRYVAAKQAEWTAKTKMELKSVFRLLQDVLGNINVSTITKPMVVELRSTLQRLPTNLYNLHSRTI
jgi:hypothetical protein